MEVGTRNAAAQKVIDPILGEVWIISDGEACGWGPTRRQAMKQLHECRDEMEFGYLLKRRVRVAIRMFRRAVRRAFKG